MCSICNAATDVGEMLNLVPQALMALQEVALRQNVVVGETNQTTATSTADVW